MKKGQVKKLLKLMEIEGVPNLLGTFCSYYERMGTDHIASPQDISVVIKEFKKHLQEQVKVERISKQITLEEAINKAHNGEY